MNSANRAIHPLARVLFMIALLSTLSCVLSAQEATGRIVGVVYDQSGAVVPGAHVVATNTATHVQRGAVSDASGAYQILSLPVGSYTISVDQKGFTPVTTKPETLDINQSLKMDIKLPVGSATEVVTVETNATTVETLSPTIGATISSSAVQDLPLNGRNVLDLALLQPGVMETNPGNGG